MLPGLKDVGRPGIDAIPLIAEGCDEWGTRQYRHLGLKRGRRNLRQKWARARGSSGWMAGPSTSPLAMRLQAAPLRMLAGEDVGCPGIDAIPLIAEGCDEWGTRPWVVAGVRCGAWVDLRRVGRVEGKKRGGPFDCAQGRAVAPAARLFIGTRERVPFRFGGGDC